MVLVEKPAHVFLQHMMCDCGGEYKPTGAMLQSQYQHRCGSCGNTAVFSNVYPKVEYKEEEET